MVKEVRKYNLNSDNIWSISAKNGMKSYMKHSKECSSDLQTPGSWFRKTLGCASVFQPTSQCLEILWKTPLFDISLGEIQPALGFSISPKPQKIVQIGSKLMKTNI